ncbi:MAG TPA: isochorismatase family cysteine hydrolase [Stellaceae bacterium]|jgi:ureidoacrylate peracid hydrolase|nr:isochorismatase family cysteine hydrolase [Stellaceae bacterium]
MSEPELLDTLARKAAPGTAALIVIDVQNDFCAEGGFFAEAGADIPSIQRAIPPLRALIDGARRAGVLVVFVTAIYDPVDLSPPMRERRLRRRTSRPLCLTGSWGADFCGVGPLPGEPVVVKHRYSGMVNTGLDALLKSRGIRSLLLTGVATDTCVESTGRDAFFIDYYVTLVADCCGAFCQRDHAVALERFDRDYGLVVSSTEIIESWAQSTVGRACMTAPHP